MSTANVRLARIRSDMADLRWSKYCVGFFHLGLNLIPLGLLSLGDELYWRLIAGLLAANNLLLAVFIGMSEMTYQDEGKASRK